MDALAVHGEHTNGAHPNVTREWRERLERRVLRPLMGSSPSYFAWIGFLAVVELWAIYAYLTQWQNGLLVTGMRDRISWGLYIISFVFFIGISHAGTLLSAILRASKARWQLPITRMAEFITVVALAVGGLFPLIDLGRPDRVLNLFFFGRWQSPLVWDLTAVCTYLMGSSIYLILPLIPDFALARDRLAQTAPTWKRMFFTTMAMGWTGTERQRKALDRAITVMMVVIIPVAVSVHTVISWIFAMTLREAFNSTIFGPYFVAGAIYSGIAAIVLLAAILRKLLHLEEYITKTQFMALGYMLGAFSLIMAYFNLNEYVTVGYKMAGDGVFHFQQLMTGAFAYPFWFYMIGGIVVPGLIILIPWTRNVKGVIFASMLVVVAMWLERYLIVAAGFRVPLMPYDPRWYTISWVEWSIFGGACAQFAMIVSLAVKVFPMVSVWEVVEHRGPEPGSVPIPDLEPERVPGRAVPERSVS